jgi:hypothetical protein
VASVERACRGALILSRLSGFRQSTGGPRVFAKEWVELYESVAQAAEQFATINAANAWVYRREAMDFACLEPPKTHDELAERKGQAAILRQLWEARLQGSQGA